MTGIRTLTDLFGHQRHMNKKYFILFSFGLNSLSGAPIGETTWVRKKLSASMFTLFRLHSQSHQLNQKLWFWLLLKTYSVAKILVWNQTGKAVWAWAVISLIKAVKSRLTPKIVVLLIKSLKEVILYKTVGVTQLFIDKDLRWISGPSCLKAFSLESKSPKFPS